MAVSGRASETHYLALLQVAPVALALALGGARQLGAHGGWPAPLLHALASGLVFWLARLSAGSRAGALVAGSLFAVSPAAARISSTGAFVAVVLGLVALLAALAVRPRARLSALVFAAAVLLTPEALPLALIIGLATRRVPWLHLGGAAVAAAAAAAAASARNQAAFEPERLELGAPALLLAVALAIAIRPGPLEGRVGVWCAALVAFALPWPALLPAPSAAAAPLFLALVVAGLGAELTRFLRRLPLPGALSASLEAALVVSYALLG